MKQNDQSYQEQQLKNFETKHTQEHEPNRTLPIPSNLVFQASDLKVNRYTNDMYRSTQAYYDSEIDQAQGNRSRNNSNRARQSSLVTKPQKMFRNEIHFVYNQQNQRQFIAYWIASKESNSGIFTHERLFVIDSQNKQLSYYSEIPQLPLQSIDELKKPKETINLKMKSKVSLITKASMIGGVTISWFGSNGRKEWNLVMGNRRMVRQFVTLIDQVTKDVYSGPRQMKKMLSAANEGANSSRVNKVETKFIAEIKQLENRKGSSQSSRVSNSIKKDLSKKEFKAVEYKNLKRIESKKEESKETRTRGQKLRIKNITQQQNSSTNLQLGQKMVQNIGNSPLQQAGINQELKLQETPSESYPDEIAVAIQKKQNIQILNNKPQSFIDNIQPKPLTSLEKLIKRRKDIDKINIQPSIPISMSKVLFKNLQEKNESQPHGAKESKRIITSEEKTAELQGQKQKRNEFSSKYLENQEKYRMAYLQERRNAQVNTNKKITAKKYGRLRSQSPLRAFSSTSNSKLKQQPKEWLLQWLQAADRTELASIYDKFSDFCVQSVIKLSQKLQKRPMVHSPSSSQHILEQNCVQFTYFIFSDKQSYEFDHQQQKSLMRQFYGINYLQTCLKFNQTIANRPHFPLICIVIYKGLNIFCQASIPIDKVLVNSDQIRSKYEFQLGEYQKISKVSLQLCDSVQICYKGTKYLYFPTAQVLPKLDDQRYIDQFYLQKFIQKGVVRNTADLQIITKHIEDELLSKTLDEMERSQLSSNIELQNILEKSGLNMSFIVQLFYVAKQKGCKKSCQILFSEIVSNLLQEHIRMCIHGLLGKNNACGKMEDVIYRQIRDFLKENKALMEIINFKLKKYLKNENIRVQRHLIKDNYLLTALLLKLGLEIDIKYRMELQKLEESQTQFWRQLSFDYKNFHIKCIHRTKGYSYKLFNSHYNYLDQQLFSRDHYRDNLQRQLTHEELMRAVNRTRRDDYQRDFMFKLMNQHEKSKVRHFFAHNQSLTEHHRRLPFDHQKGQLYYTLIHRPTSFIVNYCDISADIIGIRWLIRSKKYFQAFAKLQQQLIRILIWHKDHLLLLIQIYDLKTCLGTLMRNEHESLTASLKSLQLSIKYYQDSKDTSWEFVWEKSYQVAETHYRFEKYQKALEFYETCQAMIEENKQETDVNEVNQQFVSIYSKIAKINVLLCRVQAAVEISHENIKKYQQYFKQIDGKQANLMTRIKGQEFEAHLLLLRCFEIKNSYEDMLVQVDKCWYEYFEKKEQTQIELNNFIRNKAIELTKYAWIAVINIPNALKLKDQTSFMKISIDELKKKVEQIRNENNGTYQYTLNEVYKYIVNTVVKVQQQQGIYQETPAKKSVYVWRMVKTMHQLSWSEAAQKRCKIYDQQNQKINNLLFLECLCQIMTFQFALGVINVYANQFDF